MTLFIVQFLWLLMGLCVTVTSRACGEGEGRNPKGEVMVARDCGDKDRTSQPDEVLVAREPGPALNLTLLPSTGKPFRYLEIQDSFYGRRNVSYLVEDTGEVIVDGDVVYGTEQELLANRYQAGAGGSNDGGLFSNGTIHTFGFTIRRPWPNGVIRYKFDSDGTQALLRDQVPQAIKAWTDAIPWLQFRAEATNDAVLSMDVITIFANQDGRCWSTLGYRGPFGNSVMKMNLARDRNTGAQLCAPATPAHEFGHAIGLAHEHQRPDRNNYVNYHCENLSRGSGFRCMKFPLFLGISTFANCCSGNIPDGCCPNRGDFEIINNPGIYDSHSPYDIGSIMHYSRGVHSNGQGDTLVPARPEVVFPATAPGSPSAGDILRVCKLFRAQCPRAQDCDRRECPPSCRIIPRCNALACHSETADPPLCCNPESENEQCRQKQLECRRDCDFLKS